MRQQPDNFKPAGGGNLRAWQQLERAKKRLFYSLLRLGLPIDVMSLR